MPHSPHDALFRYTFGQPEHARGLLQAVLPDLVLAGIDWSTLRPLPGTQVDEQLRRRQSDLAFRVQRRGFETLVYVLIEHKVRPERWAVLQLLEYVLGLWRDLRKQQPGRRELPNVVPILLLQSDDGDAVESLSQLLEDHLYGADVNPGREEDDAQLGEIDIDMAQPHFEPFVVRLADISYAHRRGLALTLLSKMTVDALVHLPAADAERVTAVFVRWAPHVSRLARRAAGAPALRALWSYLAEVANVPTKTLIEIVEKTMDPLATQKFKPPIEQWRDEGREQGRQEGRQEGRQQGRQEGREQGREVGRAELLRSQLLARFEHIPDAFDRRLRSAGIEQLDVYAIRLLEAATIDEVFAD